LDVWRGDPEKGFGNMTNRQREQPANKKEEKNAIIIMRCF
jgi:hypothetical protein